MTWLDKLKGKIGRPNGPAVRDEDKQHPGRESGGTVVRKPTAVVSPSNGSQAIYVAEARVAAEWKVGDVILDLYELKKVHQGGGMGLVYRAHHRGWNTDLAIKSPRSDFFQTEDQKKDFTRECKAWINLGLHPHIVSCYYVRSIDDIPRVFAEYVEGGSLEEWIENRRLYEGGPDAALKRILDTAIQMAWGLQYAHEQGLIHQDVKPANVLMMPDGMAKICDFGLAKARVRTGESVVANVRQTSLVSSGGMTPAYCSPEQANFEPLSHKTDIWSWAVSVLEMLTGRATWLSGIAAPEVLRVLDDLRATELQLPRTPAILRSALEHAFQVRPGDRPKNIMELARRLSDLYRSVAGEEFPRSLPQDVELRADSLNNRAVSFLDLGSLPESEQLLAEALRVDPTHPEANFNYQLLLWRLGRVTDASAINSLNNLLQAEADTLLRG